MRPDHRPHPGRRTLLAGVLGLGAGTLSGCGIRLEDDAPRVPLVPARTRVPAEDLLIALTADCRRLADLARSSGLPVGALLATLHRRQHTVLRTTLLRAGVPEDALGTDDLPSPAPTSPPASPTATSSASPTTTSSGRPTNAAGDRMAAAEGDAAAGASRFVGVDETLRAPLAALHAQRYAAASILAGAPPAVPTDPLDGHDVADLASATAAAAYLMEVAAARSSGPARERAGATLDAFRWLEADQLAGGAAAPVALGHHLPFTVESSADAARLAVRAVTDLRTTTGASLAGLVTHHHGPGLAAATRWLGTLEVEAHRWGQALQPFPGLS